MHEHVYLHMHVHVHTHVVVMLVHVVERTSSPISVVLLMSAEIDY